MRGFRWLSRPEVLWCGAAVLSTFLPFAWHWDLVGSSDFDQFAVFNQIVLWWHQLGDGSVTWNPFLCGGATLVGNPQITLVHPHVAWIALFGSVNALGVSLVPWVVAGFFGMRALARDHGLRTEVSNGLAAAWTANGFVVAHLGSMHAMFWAFLLLPVLAFLHRLIAREGDRRALAVYPFVVALLGLYNFQFVAYGLPFAALHFGLELLYAPGRWSARAGRGAGYGAALMLALGMMSLFLLPGLAWNREFPRFKPAQAVHPLDLLQMVALPVPLVSFHRDHRAHEYMLTLGPVLFGLALWGLRRGAARRAQPTLLVTVAAFVTAVGTWTAAGLPAVGPFDLLRRFVPGYQAVRVPARFFVHGLMGLLIAAGFGWQDWIDERRWGPRARWALAGVAVVPLLLFGFGYYQFRLYRSIEGVQTPRPAFVASDFHWAPPGRGRAMYEVLRPNVGVLDCYEALEIPRAPELSHERGLVLDTDFDVDIERLSWGEMVIRLRSAPGETGHLKLNFNHHRGWTVMASDGAAAIVSSSRQPLTLRLGPDVGFVRIRHLDPSWARGVSASAVSLALAVGFGATLLLTRRRSRGKGDR